MLPKGTAATGGTFFLSGMWVRLWSGNWGCEARSMRGKTKGIWVPTHRLLVTGPKLGTNFTVKWVSIRFSGKCESQVRVGTWCDSGVENSYL